MGSRMRAAASTSSRGVAKFDRAAVAAARRSGFSSFIHLGGGGGGRCKLGFCGAKLSRAGARFLYNAIFSSPGIDSIHVNEGLCKFTSTSSSHHIKGRLCHICMRVRR